MIINGRLCIHPFKIFDPGTRSITKSSGTFQKQSIAILRIGLSWDGGSCYMWYFFIEELLLCASPFLVFCPVLRKHYIVFDQCIGLEKLGLGCFYVCIFNKIYWILRSSNSEGDKWCSIFGQALKTHATVDVPTTQMQSRMHL
jgi:hypothetical protein